MHSQPDNSSPASSAITQVIILSTNSPHGYRSHLADALREQGLIVTFVHLKRAPIIYLTSHDEGRTTDLASFVMWLRKSCQDHPATLIINSTTTSYPFWSLLLKSICGGLWCFDLYDNFAVVHQDAARRFYEGILQKILAWSSDFVIRPSLTSVEVVPRSLYLPSASHVRPVERVSPDFSKVLILASFEQRTDFQFIEQTARACPQRQFHLLGRMIDMAEQEIARLLQANDNIKYFGAYQDADLGQILGGYAIMFAPYLANNFYTRYIDPNRYRHGLNSGLEVVTTEVPFSHVLGDRLHIVASPEQAASVFEKIEHEPDFRRSLGHPGQIYVWSDVATQLLDMAADVRKNGKPPESSLAAEEAAHGGALKR